MFELCCSVPVAWKTRFIIVPGGEDLSTPPPGLNGILVWVVELVMLKQPDCWLIIAMVEVTDMLQEPNIPAP